MSGKPYSIGEFKMIVDYIVQNKLYSETRARKMWMDFANTNLTSRTWQSLKEAFLKRVLPDIQNPYYNLTNEQIGSFRSRRDLADKSDRKLDIQTISDDSNSNGVKDNESSNNGNIGERETIAGENTKCSMIPQRSRSSADTVILDNCFEPAEEIRNDSETNGDNETDVKPGVGRSLRDCITYSEPLTPMLQEVLDDFASEPEDSDRENQMQIVDSVPETDTSNDTRQIPEAETEVEVTSTKIIATDVAKNAKGLSAEIVEEVLAQELDGSKSEKTSPKKKAQNVEEEIQELPVIDLDEEFSSMQAENGTEKYDEVNSETVESTNNVTAENTREQAVKASETTECSVNNNSHSEPQGKSGDLNNSNSTVDASLPNNPEALNNKIPKKAETINNTDAEQVAEVSNISNKTQSQLKSARKRSSSLDAIKNLDKKKQKLEIKLKSKTDKNPELESHMEVEEVQLKVNDESNKTTQATTKKPQHEKTDFSKPSTSYENNKAEVNNTQKQVKTSPQIKNPCLENVSLFDEQFNKTIHNMSESSDTEQNMQDALVDTNQATILKETNDVVMLESHTESDAEETSSPPKKKPRTGVVSTKTDRDKAISNLFGVTSGAVESKRKRRLSRRRRTISHNNANAHHNAPVSCSSDWTSASESETFVSPPRGRRNRMTKKYQKPKSARILSLEEEGGLFVMYGKKIYPLVKDGKIVKNYLTYLPESDSEEEKDSYWKLKYVEEKKKAAELKKLLDKAKEPPSRDAASPILQANPLRKSTSSHEQRGESSNAGKEICVPIPEEKKEEPKVNPPEKIKIKFTKNNEEVHLEGHWPQIHPVLEQVVHIFHKEVESAANDAKSKMIVVPPEHSKEPSSGNSTPIIITPLDPEVHEKVAKIEKEIFKEIEERDREEETKPNEEEAKPNGEEAKPNGEVAQQNGEETNVTKRRGRPRKSSDMSPVKNPKKSDEAEKKVTEENKATKKRKATDNENKASEVNEVTTKRQSRTPRKVLNETVNTNDTKTIQTRRSKKLNTSNEEEEVKYMLPPRSTRLSLRSPANKQTQRNKRSLPKIQKTFSSPENFSLNSMESTQGYQDSDVSPLKTELRKKKRIDASTFTIKTRNSLRRSSRRKSHPYLYCDAYNDSNSSADTHIEVVARENSSLNTEAYRSESYQLLMPRPRVPLRQLESIDETTPIDNQTYFVKRLEHMNDEVSASKNNNFTSQSGQMTSDIGSSSNMSLPVSPELSIVEAMSISKEILNSIEDYPTINEIQNNELNEPTLCNKFLMSDVDVSVPLMEQECELESCSTTNGVTAHTKHLVTESLLSKIGTFNINDQVSATDTLDKKLHELLLDSAKKMNASAKNKVSTMEVDVTNTEVEKKAKARKRCSTPRKRKGAKKSLAPIIDPVVEEEHVESCSHSGRKSCPAQFETYTMHNDHEKVVTEEIASLTIAQPKGKKKKDIIKVKIQRPKNKRSQEKLRTKSAQNSGNISVFTDSGINDTESEMFVPMNESVDLIHNHSETCLHANDCVGDSLEFIDNSKSVITVGDSMQSGDNAWNSRENNDVDNISPDFFCNNAQDVSTYNKANTDNMENTSDTVYHSPLGTDVSHNSLITEDLSDEPPEPPARPSKWYLLSEDETTNTYIAGHPSPMLNAGSFKSNLKQLFPITCAIPDLSTITEMSRENYSSGKPMSDIDGLTGDDFNSQSVFDSNF